MKNMIKKMLDAPSTLWISLSVGILFTIAGVVNEASIVGILGIWFIVILILIRAYISENIFKALLSVYVSLYISSGFTVFVSSNDKYIIEPFFTSIFMFSIFIAQSYSTKYYQIHMRSRWLWVSIIMIIYNMMRFISYGITENYISSEIFGLVFGLGLTFLWRTWAILSNTGIEIKDDDILELSDKIVVHVDQMLNTDTMKWGNTPGTASIEAKADIANLLARAIFNEKELIVITPGGNDILSKELYLKNFLKGTFIIIQSSDENYIKSAIETEEKGE